MAVTRKRRRLLIAMLIAALLVSGGWRLTRTRVDPRFVGTWEILYLNDREVMTLWPSGDGESRINDFVEPLSFRWFVEGDQFLVESAAELGWTISDLKPRLMRLYARMTGSRDPSATLWPREILEVGPDTIRLKQPALPPGTTLRIPSDELTLSRAARSAG